MNSMGDGVAVLQSGKTYSRNADVNYEFRQNSDFYYLTGFDEPGSVLLLVPGRENKSILFVTPDNYFSKLYGSIRLGVKGAVEIIGADIAFPITSFDSVLTEILKNENKVFYNYTDIDLKKKIEQAWGTDKTYHKLNRIVNEMRLYKDESEILRIKRACEITAEAINDILTTAEPGMFEYELEAILDYIFKKNNSRHAFPPIVASGNNALILHYQENNKELKNGEVVVLDVGAEFKYYASDITRTFPVSGKFSHEQKLIYEVVLNAQKSGISFAKKGIGFRELQDKVKDSIAEGLLKLGLITNKENSWQVDIWMPHGISHMLGLDVHDVGNTDLVLKEGNIFTIEPGIYINAEALDNQNEFMQVDKKEYEEFVSKVKSAVEKFKGIGIRIEDDILITENGCEVLSSTVPKEIAEIENLMKLKSRFNK